jgi:hypothetical protein
METGVMVREGQSLVTVPSVAEVPWQEVCAQTSRGGA